MDGLSEELATAQKTTSELQEALKDAEGAKEKLQEIHEEEVSHLKAQIKSKYISNAFFEIIFFSPFVMQNCPHNCNYRK